ncbi:hypothetical protein ACFWIN_02240 [Streptomyces sp. NPDC127049]|uniref:hypothetical protein n=1 Tax=Streptomyces sp. NPDC127049 TaxID=3347118 RepID=UPI0036619F0C
MTVIGTLIGGQGRGLTGPREMREALSRLPTDPRELLERVSRDPFFRSMMEELSFALTESGRGAREPGRARSARPL